ncbi:MAG: hypothetical protein ACI4IX_06290 [Acutalibacteraceae bacterium]
MISKKELIEFLRTPEAFSEEELTELLDEELSKEADELDTEIVDRISKILLLISEKRDNYNEICENQKNGNFKKLFWAAII